MLVDYLASAAEDVEFARPDSSMYTIGAVPFSARQGPRDARYAAEIVVGKVGAASGG